MLGSWEADAGALRRGCEEVAGDYRGRVADGAGKCWWPHLRGAPEGPVTHPKNPHAARGPPRSLGPMSGFRDYFGITPQTIEEGSAKNPRAGSLVCHTCGALVAYDTQLLHRDRHRGRHTPTPQNDLTKRS